MFIYAIESIIVGIVVFIIGTILFNLSINRNNKNYEKPNGIDFAFFTTGIILYLVMELFLSYRE
jgi:hypothetical protein